MKELTKTNLNGRAGNNTAGLSRDDERKLVEEAKSDPIAFGRLFDIYYDRVFKYLLHRTANATLAHDLSSNTFYKVMKGLRLFEWKGITLTAWLYRIASNEANKYYRRNKNYVSVSINEHCEQIEDASSAADRALLEAENRVSRKRLFLQMHAEISLLKPKYQEVIVLKYFECKKMIEIAEITGKSLGTVKSLLHRGQNQLRLKLETIYFQEVGQ